MNLTDHWRSALLVTVNLAAAAIYFVHLGRIGLGGYHIDLDVYRTGARVLLHGGDLYGRLPRLADGHQLPFTYPPFAALSFIPLALAGYTAANWLLTAATIAAVAVSPWPARPAADKHACKIGQLADACMAWRPHPGNDPAAPCANEGGHVPLTPPLRRFGTSVRNRSMNDP